MEDIVVVSSDCSSVLFGGSVMFVCVVGVSLKESVFFLSIRIGLLVVLCIFIFLLFMTARVGGSQLVDLLCCDTGNSASPCVLGTVQRLPSRDI